jgi:hypothetical protein
MNKPLFITACILAVITILVYSFVASVIYKKTLCQKSPYYFCDTSWQCCSKGNANCLASKGGAVLGKDLTPTSYAITDRYYGGLNTDGTKTEYQKFCVDPVNNALLAYQPGQPFDLSCLYDATKTCSPTGIIPTDLIGKCVYRPLDNPSNPDGTVTEQLNYYPSSTDENDPGNWKNPTADPNSAAYQEAFANAATGGTNTQKYSCFNTFYAGAKYDQC